MRKTFNENPEFIFAVNEKLRKIIMFSISIPVKYENENTIFFLSEN